MSLPDFEDIKVDLEQEIERLAAKDGIENKKLLEITIQMTRREYYAASIVQWYRGRDQGYVEGVASMGSDIPKRLWYLFLAGAGVATAIVFPLTYVLCRH